MLEGLALYTFLAILCERVTEALFGLPFDKVKGAEPYKWILVYVGMGVGVAIAWMGQLDLILDLAQIDLKELGIVLTGISIGGGANLLHQVWPGSAEN